MKNYYFDYYTRQRLNQFIAFAVLHFVIYLTGALFSYFANIYAGILLIGWGLISYVFHKDRTGDMLDAVAVFSLMWTGSIGVAQFRLSAVQEEWLVSVWIIFALMPILFWMAFSLTQHTLWCKCIRSIGRNGIDTIQGARYKPQKYINVALWSGIICILLLAVQYKIKGYFPALSSDPNARFNFYLNP